MRAQRSIGLVPGLNNLMAMLQQHARLFSGNVSFGFSMSNTDQGNNMSCWKATGTTPAAANTDFAIAHTLGRVPITIVGQDTNNGGLLFRSPSTAWTSTTIYLQCTTGSAAYNVIVA